MEDVGIQILRPLVYFNAIFVSNWYILWLFGIFFHVVVCRTKKNLSTLL
jgi:hypothetical protein